MATGCGSIGPDIGSESANIISGGQPSRPIYAKENTPLSVPLV